MKALLFSFLILLTGCPGGYAAGTGALQSLNRMMDNSRDRQAGMSAYEAERLALERERLEIERQRQRREILRDYDTMIRDNQSQTLDMMRTFGLFP